MYISLDSVQFGEAMGFALENIKVRFVTWLCRLE